MIVAHWSDDWSYTSRLFWLWVVGNRSYPRCDWALIYLTLPAHRHQMLYDLAQHVPDTFQIYIGYQTQKTNIVINGTMNVNVDIIQACTNIHI